VSTRLLRQFVVFALALAAGFYLGGSDGEQLLGYVVAVGVGLVGAALTRAPLGLALLWSGALLGALLGLEVSGVSGSAATGELSSRLPLLGIAFVLGSAAFLGGRAVLSGPLGRPDAQ
jgi:hypothetical protein